MKKIVLCALASIAMVAAECPNGCSGNGQCTASEQCVCSKHSIVINKDGNEDNVEYVAFTGADCSQQTCPRGTSWIQVPAKPDPGKNVFCSHLKGVECSDKGICNREKGQCECFPGYTGAACQRTECPNDCSGHGSCQSNIKFAEDATKAMQPSAYKNYDINAIFQYHITYDNAWDSNLHYGCKCDPGFRGPDCSKQECPSAHDSLDLTCSKLLEQSLVEFIGEEYFYQNPSSKFNPNMAPLPNKMLLYVENYINNPAYHKPDSLSKMTGGTTFEKGQMSKEHPWNGNGVELGYTAFNGECDMKVDGNPVPQNYPYYQDDAGTLYAYTSSELSTLAKRKELAGGWKVANGEAVLVDGALLYTKYNNTQETFTYSSVTSTAELYRRDESIAKEAKYKRCVRGVYCGGKTSGQVCSGRGLCDYSSGVCQCHPGYKGYACETPKQVT